MVTAFQSSASNGIAFCPVGIPGISDGRVIRARSFLGYQRVPQCYCALLVTDKIHHKHGRK